MPIFQTHKANAIEGDPQPLKDILSGNSLQNILAKARLLLRIQSKIANLLESDVTAHCRVSNMEGDLLTLAFDSSAWATQMRYRARQLIMQFSNDPELKHIKQIRCIVRPE